MKSELRWLRASYWVAAAADFAIAVLVLIPERMGVADYVYPMGLMAAAAFSWGVLLVAADRKPLERRWVLLPTMLVVALLGGVAVHAGSVGLLPASRAVTTSVVTATVLLVLILGYRRSRAVDRGD